QWFAQNSALDETVPREEAVPATRQTSLSCQQINKTLKDYLLEVEKNYIDRALKAHRGNITHTAKVLGISRTTLYHRFHDKEVV
ncbi:MAG TPA: helix-turn-helix domain-containing protein, partial [bacterium]|nr:helix-turn-helix domain-containing protein [bacterium]